MGVYIRQDEGRSPGANTVAYYPFDSSLNDYSGSNPRTIARGTATYSDKMVSINTIRYNSNIITGTGDFTINAYMSFGDSSFEANFWSSDNNNWYPRLFIRLSGIGIWNTDGTWYQATLQTNLNTNQVYLCTYVRESNNIYYYVNGQLAASNTSVPSIDITGGTGCYIGGYYNTNTSGKIGNLILENVAWSAADVLKYYNDTKSTYGL